MTIPGSGSALLLRRPAAGGYQISRSLRFNSSDSAYLSRTPASAGNRKTWTWAGWVKRSGLGSFQKIFGNEDSSELNGVAIQFRSDNSLQVYDITSSVQWQKITTAVYRDPSSWYHLVVAVDTTNGTAGDRVKIYINGVRETSFSTSSDPSPSADTQLNTTTAHGIGRSGAYNGSYFNGYLADIYFIDGQALDPTSFGEFDANGIWQPIEYTGSYGTNGFHLDFADNASTTTIGYDAAGSNDWTANNLSVTAGAGNDSLVDVPTNGAQTDTGAGGEVRGNYATLNPLDTKLIQSNGNLDATASTSQTWVSGRGTFGVTSGKWYWEITLNSVSTSSDNVAQIGIHALTSALPANDAAPNADAYVYVNYTGQAYNNGSGSSYGATWTTGDVIGVAYDADNGTLAFYKNGSSQGTAYSSLSASKVFAPIVSLGRSSTSTSVSVNFGQRPFAYTAPSGFKALNTANLPAPLVTKPNTVMDVALWTGNGSTQTISGLAFDADFLWIKRRDSTNSHQLTDVVRGLTKYSFSDGAGAEENRTNQVTATSSSGFSLGSNAAVNASSSPYVGWAWDAGSSTVTNTQGSITSSVRANATAGFSIVTYTGNGSAGATVGHGLGVAPSMIIIKNRDAADAWQVYHAANTANPETDYLVLNTTAATADNINRWNDTAPTSTLFTLGDGVEVNTNTEDYVAYCWTGLVGYSSFGSYTGNGSSDGPFVFCNFRPRWILIKVTTTTAGWLLYDTARSTYNVVDKYLLASSANAEGTFTSLDILSNGFKLRGVDASLNQSSQTYVYAAFAESPFNYSRAR